MEQQIDEAQPVNSNQHQAYSSTLITPIPPIQPEPVARSDIPETLPRVLSTAHERLELDSETTSDFRWASSYGMLSQIPYEARNIKSGEIIVMAEGYHTEGTQNIISAATRDEGKAILNLAIASQKVSSIFSRRRITFALCLVSFGVLFPVIVVKLFRVKEQSQTIQSSTSRYEKMLDDNPPVSEAQLMWRKHVVVGGDNRLLIPETFESRLNADVAPLLEEHVGQVWDHRSYPELICRSGEHLIVRFSMMKSSTVPASLSHKADCIPTSNARTSCFQHRALSDVRDLTVTLPSKSSRYTFSVKLTENAKQTAQKRDSSISKTISLGAISGPFDIELSESSILAIHRYCGTHRKEFVDDLNVKVKVATLENTRLLTIYELKRLYALWSKLKSNNFLRREDVWDTNRLSKATIDPIEHSRHMTSSFEAKSLWSKTLSPSSDKTQISSPSVDLTTLRDLQNMYQGNDSDAVTQFSPEADSMIAKRSAPPNEHLPTLEKQVRRESPLEQLALEPWHHNSEAFSGPQETVDSQEDAHLEAAVKSPTDSTSTPDRSARATDSGVGGQLQDNNLEMNPQSDTARGSHKHEQTRGRIYRKLSLHQTTTPPSPGTSAGQYMENSHVPYQVAVRTPGALETITKQNKHDHDYTRAKRHVSNNTVLLPFESPPSGSAHTVSPQSITIERYSFKPQRPRPDKGKVDRFRADPQQHVFKSQPNRGSVPEREGFESKKHEQSFTQT